MTVVCSLRVYHSPGTYIVCCFHDITVGQRDRSMGTRGSPGHYSRKAEETLVQWCLCSNAGICGQIPGPAVPPHLATIARIICPLLVGERRGGRAEEGEARRARIARRARRDVKEGEAKKERCGSGEERRGRRKGAGGAERFYAFTGAVDTQGGSAGGIEPLKSG